MLHRSEDARDHGRDVGDVEITADRAGLLSVDEQCADCALDVGRELRGCAAEVEVGAGERALERFAAHTLVEPTATFMHRE